MQQSGISSCTLLRTDGVGNHDAQIRETLLGWFSERRPRKAWFAPPVIASQKSSTRWNLRDREMVPTIFLVCRSGFANWWSHLLGTTSERCWLSKLEKLWLVRRCRNRPSPSFPLTFPNVKNLKRDQKTKKQSKTKKEKKIKKKKKRGKTKNENKTKNGKKEKRKKEKREEKHLNPGP